MRGVTMLVENAGSVRATELDCSIQEEDWVRGESYSANWHSVSLIPRPQNRQTVIEVDHTRRHTFSRQWEARRLLQRFLSGAIRLGSLEQEKPLWALQSPRPQPTMTSSGLGVRKASWSPHTQEGVRYNSVPKRSMVGVGVTRDLPPVKSTTVCITKVQESLGRALSQETQRG